MDKILICTNLSNTCGGVPRGFLEIDKPYILLEEGERTYYVGNNKATWWVSKRCFEFMEDYEYKFILRGK